MFENFENYIINLININGSIINLIKKSTKRILDLKERPNNTELMEIGLRNMIPGRFYLISYYYNGNTILAPILALEYKILNNKRILYGVNLEYIPFKLKIKIFSILFNKLQKTLEKISNTKMLISEESLPFTFQIIYNVLKVNNINFTITAFDTNKIKKVYLTSVNILPQTLTCDFKIYNSNVMKTLYTNIVDNSLKEKLNILIEQYDKIINDYDTDSLSYHKTVKAIEEKFKLFK